MLCINDMWPPDPAIGGLCPRVRHQWVRYEFQYSNMHRYLYLFHSVWTSLQHVIPMLRLLPLHSNRVHVCWSRCCRVVASIQMLGTVLSGDSVWWLIRSSTVSNISNSDALFQFGPSDSYNGVLGRFQLNSTPSKTLCVDDLWSFQFVFIYQVRILQESFCSIHFRNGYHILLVCELS